MSFSNFNANINFKHFKCCYHDADDICKFYAILWKYWHEHVMKHLSPWKRQRKWCHFNISMTRQLIEMSVQKKVWTYGTCKRRCGDPGYRGPTWRWHGKVQQTILQIKWSSICNELHIDKTPHLSYLVCSRLGTQQYYMLLNMSRGET